MQEHVINRDLGSFESMQSSCRNTSLLQGWVWQEGCCHLRLGLRFSFSPAARRHRRARQIAVLDPRVLRSEMQAPRVGLGTEISFDCVGLAQWEAI